MENASKALLMAAGVLLGILILSLAIYLFVSFGQTSAEINEKNRQQQIVQFNSQYTVYLGRKDLKHTQLLKRNFLRSSGFLFGMLGRSFLEGSSI